MRKGLWLNSLLKVGIDKALKEGLVQFTDLVFLTPPVTSGSIDLSASDIYYCAFSHLLNKF